MARPIKTKKIQITVAGTATFRKGDLTIEVADADLNKLGETEYNPVNSGNFQNRKVTYGINTDPSCVGKTVTIILKTIGGYTDKMTYRCV